MSKTYNNVPMSESERKRVEKQDEFWDGPKLIVLCAITLGVALTVLWLAANQYIGPTFHS